MTLEIEERTHQECDVMEWHELRVSGSFLFEPPAPGRPRPASVDGVRGEYEDGTIVEIIHDPLARWVTVRCNQPLWMQMMPDGRLIITTIDGADHTMGHANDGPEDGPKRVIRGF